MKIVATITAGAILAASLSGCSSIGQLDPNSGAASAIHTAYTALCSPTGILTAAQPFASQPPVSTYYPEVVALCANGEPNNEITAGVDIFDLYVDVSQALAKRSAVPASQVKKAKALKASVHG